MLLNIVKAKQNIGKSFNFELTCPRDDSLIEDRGCSFLSDIDVSGEYVYRSEMLFLKCHAVFTIKGMCDNCGEEITIPLQFDFEENFVESSSASDLDNYVINQITIEIDKVVYDNLLYHLPSRFLCKEDCQGLCSVCGKNKNFYSCNCEEIQDEALSQEQNPFSKLKIIGDK